MGLEKNGRISQFSKEKSFSEFLTEEQEFLRALIRTIGVASSDVMDVLQDANVYLVTNQSKYLPGTNFRAWAAQVVRFRCANYFRRIKRSPMVNLSEEVLDLIAGETALRFGENHARLEYLGECLAELPEKQRQLLAVVYAKGSSLKALAQAQNTSHAAMRKTVSRIRQALKACIQSKSEN